MYGNPLLDACSIQHHTCYCFQRQSRCDTDHSNKEQSQNAFFLCISQKSRPYCEIISVRGNPCSWLPWITLANEFTNLWIIICSIFINIFLITLPKKFPRPSSALASHQHWQKWFNSSHEMKVADDRNSANMCWNINTSYLICICGSYQSPNNPYLQFFLYFVKSLI